MLDIIDSVTGWIEAGDPVALATVIRTWGSSPRREGAKMAVTTRSRLVGSVSGGCVEAAVVESAQEVLAGGASRRLHFGVSDDSAWEVGLSCGGELEVWLEGLDPLRWAAMVSAFRGDRACAYVRTLPCDKDAVAFLFQGDTVVWSHPAQLKPPAELLATAQQTLVRGISGVTTVEGLEVLVDVEIPRPKLIMVGGAHVARALSKMAILLGYRVILVDPRRVFASRERFPELNEIHHDYPDRVFPQIRLDERTAVVVLTHDPKIDDPALIAALPSPAPYVGVLSSKKTHRKRLERLRQAGVDGALLERIRVPIGLDLGGRSPEEIALAILAEITAVRYQAPISRRPA